MRMLTRMTLRSRLERISERQAEFHEWMYARHWHNIHGVSDRERLGNTAYHIGQMKVWRDIWHYAKNGRMPDQSEGDMTDIESYLSGVSDSMFEEYLDVYLKLPEDAEE